MNVAPAEIERAQIAAALAERLAGKAGQGGDQAADEFAAFLRLAIGAPRGEQGSAAAFEKQRARQARTRRGGHRQLARRAPAQARADAQFPAVERGQAIQPLVHRLDDLAEGVRHRRDDELAGQRIKRLDHHVLGIADLVLDGRHHHGGDGLREFAMPRDFRAAQGLDKDFRRGGFQARRVADALVQRLDRGLDGLKPRGLAAEQQGL